MVRVLTVPAELQALASVRHFVGEAVRACGGSDEVAADLLIAVDEAVTNIVSHGYRADTGEIEIEAGPAPGGLAIRIRDSAPRFDLDSVPSADLQISPLDRADAGGFGVELIRRLVDEVRYEVRTDGRNELTLLRRLEPAARAGQATS